MDATQKVAIAFLHAVPVGNYRYAYEWEGRWYVSTSVSLRELGHRLVLADGDSEAIADAVALWRRTFCDTLMPAWWMPTKPFACIGCDADEEATPLPGTTKVYETYATLQEAKDEASEDPEAFATYDGRIITADLYTSREIPA